jgi:hypothetical protein
MGKIIVQHRWRVKSPEKLLVHHGMAVEKRDCISRHNKPVPGRIINDKRGLYTKGGGSLDRTNNNILSARGLSIPFRTE